jgi:hypothetical protein
VFPATRMSCCTCRSEAAAASLSSVAHESAPIAFDYLSRCACCPLSRDAGQPRLVESALLIFAAMARCVLICTACTASHRLFCICCRSPPLVPLFFLPIASSKPACFLPYSFHACRYVMGVLTQYMGTLNGVLQVSLFCLFFFFVNSSDVHCFHSLLLPLIFWLSFLNHYSLLFCSVLQCSNAWALTAATCGWRP